MISGYSTLQRIALKQALEEKYKGNKIEEDSDTSSYGRTYYYNIISVRPLTMNFGAEKSQKISITIK